MHILFIKPLHYRILKIKDFLITNTFKKKKKKSIRLGWFEQCSYISSADIKIHCKIGYFGL